MSVYSISLILFLCFRYMKGTQERGSILGSVDEIVLTLDDNAMNLQSMSASRFVGPFLEKVQKWEKSLSLISEVVEVSLDHFMKSLYKHYKLATVRLTVFTVVGT